MGPSQAQGERRPLSPGLAELAAGGTVEAWAALWHGRQDVRRLGRVSACGNLFSFTRLGLYQTGATKEETQSSGLLLLPRHLLVSKAGVIEAEVPLFQVLITFSFHLIPAIGFRYGDNHIGSEIHLFRS